MSSKLEPVIWLCDTSQLVPCFDRMSKINDVCFKPRLGISWSLTAILCDIFCHWAQGLHLRYMALAMLTIKKSFTVFYFYVCM